MKLRGKDGNSFYNREWSYLIGSFEEMFRLMWEFFYCLLREVFFVLVIMDVFFNFVGIWV